MFKTSLTLLALAISTATFADDAINKKQLIDEQMERIIVSGSRVFESIDEVPRSLHQLPLSIKSKLKSI